MNLEQIQRKCHVNADGCWLWRGHCNRVGAPRVSRLSGRRVVWELTTGEVLPRHLFVSVTCSHPNCLRFGCLVLGTRSEYLKRRDRLKSVDVIARITIARRRASNCKLTIEKAREIRARSAAGETGISIAPLYGIHHSMVSKIIRNEFWREPLWAGL